MKSFFDFFWCKLHWILTNVLHHVFQAWYFACSTVDKLKKNLIVTIIFIHIRPSRVSTDNGAIL